MNPNALRDLLISWADINSGSDHAVGLERMRAALREEFPNFQMSPLRKSRCPKPQRRRCLFAAVRRRRHRFFSAGHYDTVYSATHPFQQCTLLDADTLRGPGVADMKGGIVVMLAQRYGRHSESSPAAKKYRLGNSAEPG